MSQFYSDKAALADRLLLKFGYDATVTGRPTQPDPVTGAGGGAGVARTVRAVNTKIDYKTFPETLVRTGDTMLILGGLVEVGEAIAGKAVKQVAHVQPDNATHIITKALVQS